MRLPFFLALIGFASALNTWVLWWRGTEKMNLFLTPAFILVSVLIVFLKNRFQKNFEERNLDHLLALVIFIASLSSWVQFTRTNNPEMAFNIFLSLAMAASPASLVFTKPLKNKRIDVDDEHFKSQIRLNFTMILVYHVIMLSACAMGNIRPLVALLSNMCLVVLILLQNLALFQRRPLNS